MNQVTRTVEKNQKEPRKGENPVPESTSNKEKEKEGARPTKNQGLFLLPWEQLSNYSFQEYCNNFNSYHMNTKAGHTHILLNN